MVMRRAGVAGSSGALGSAVELSKFTQWTSAPGKPSVIMSVITRRWRWHCASSSPNKGARPSVGIVRRDHVPSHRQSWKRLSRRRRSVVLSRGMVIVIRFLGLAPCSPTPGLTYAINLCAYSDCMRQWRLRVVPSIFPASFFLVDAGLNHFPSPSPLDWKPLLEK